MSGDGEHGEPGHADQNADLLAPIGQRRRYGRRRHDQNWKAAQCASRTQPVLAVQRAVKRTCGSGAL